MLAVNLKNGHTSPPSSSSLFIYARCTLLGAINNMDNSNAMGVRSLPYDTCSGGQVQHGSAQSRCKCRLQPHSDSANPILTSSDILVLAAETSSKKVNIPNCFYARGPNVSLTKLLALQLLQFQIVEFGPS